MEPNWKPLIARLGENRCAGFMFTLPANTIPCEERGFR